jgi:hypothetical protein
MAVGRRYQALRALTDVEKLYRVNQNKVLGVMRRYADSERKTAALKALDDVKEGVCFALSLIWLQAMLDSNRRLRPGDPFGDRRAEYTAQVKYFTDAKVVVLQRAYVERAKKGSEDEMTSFIESALRERELTLKDAQYRLTPSGDFDRALKKLVADIRHTCRQDTGICVHITVGRKGRHAVAVFLSTRPEEPLLFFDANCGCYRLRASDDVQLQFFGTWSQITKDIFEVKDLAIQAYCVVQRQ